MIKFRTQVYIVIDVINKLVGYLSKSNVINFNILAKQRKDEVQYTSVSRDKHFQVLLAP